MFSIIGLIKAAVLNGTPLLFGTAGEILTEKSGNLNLGVEGLMFMGGAFGLAGAYVYSVITPNPIGFVAIIIAIVSAFISGVFGSLIYSFLTITLKANQNVTGLALTIFGTGVGQFIGEIMRIRIGGNVTIPNVLKNAFVDPVMPGFLRNIPYLGDILFSYNIFVYLGIVMVTLMHYFLYKTRKGLNLRAVGESCSTADAAGINTDRYRYFATCIGGGISAVGGMIYIMTISGCVWNYSALSGEGWIAVALVIFCFWKPLNSIWGSILFGGLLILYLKVPVPFIPTQIYKIVPYIATILVLIFVSMKQKKENQPPHDLGVNYFREDR